MRRAATVAVRGKRAGSSRGASSPSSSSASPRLPRTVSRPPMKAPTPLSRPESSATRVSASARIVAWAWLALPRARSMRPSRPTHTVQQPADPASSTMVTGAWSTSGPDMRPGWAASAASSSAPPDTASGAPFPPPTSRPASDSTALPPNRAACSASSTVEDVAVIPNLFQGRAIAWPYDATKGPATIPAPLCTEGRSRGGAGGFLDHRGHPEQLVVSADPPHQRRPDRQPVDQPDGHGHDRRAGAAERAGQSGQRHLDVHLAAIAEPDRLAGAPRRHHRNGRQRG